MAFGLADHGRTVHGEHNDRGLGQEVFDGCSRFEPIHLGHGEVQDYKIRFELCSSGDGLAARHGVTANFPFGMGFEHAADSAQHGLVIVGNEDAFQRPRTCSQTIRADCRAPYRIMPRGGLAHFGAIDCKPHRLRLRCSIVPLGVHLQEEQKIARPWRIVAAEAAQEMDCQKLLPLLEELNAALEQQGLVKPDGQRPRDKSK
jgi:hypothetical protein